MFIDFEGIDGSGKTTLSNRVAARLRQLGHRVCHAREGGALASPIAEKIRSVTRDPHHLALGDPAELLLYAAREAQTLEEVIRPALQRDEWVIADRYTWSHLALAKHGRGMESPLLEKVLEFAAGGVMPDLVIVVDVDPNVARARKRCAKIRERRTGDGSRKGQGGAGLAARVRQGFLELAARDPARFVVIDNTWGSLDEAEETLTRLILERASGGRCGLRRESEQSAAPTGLASFPRGAKDREQVQRGFLAAVDGIAQREPQLAAYLLGGLSGSDVDGRRFRLARVAPEVVAWGLEGVQGEGAMALRHALKDIEPRYVARSLRGLSDADAFLLREELAGACPEEVAYSLTGLASPRARALRESLAPLAPVAALKSLAGLDDEAAWKLRDGLGAEGGDALAESLTGLDTPRSWALRVKLLNGSPLAVIESLCGLKSEESFHLRDRFMKRAPRAVLKSIEGFDDDRSWRLRESVGERMREALDSVLGVDSERAWALREKLAPVWPAAAIGSLGHLAHGARGAALLHATLDRAASDVEALRQATFCTDPVRALEVEGALQVAV